MLSNATKQALKSDGMTKIKEVEVRRDRNGYPEILIEATGPDGLMRFRGWLRDGESVTDINWEEL